MVEETYLPTENIPQTTINLSPIAPIFSQTRPFLLQSASATRPLSSSGSSSQTENSAGKKEKSVRNRALYNFRKKQIEIEESRINEIKLLREAVEKNNLLQAERNEIMKKLVEQRSNPTENIDV